MRVGESFDISNLTLVADGNFRRMQRLPTLIRHASRDTFSRKREKGARSFKLADARQ
jgi:hypothetical protein